MQDLEVGVRRRPPTLSAISGEGGTTIGDEGGGKVHPFVDDGSVVPAGPLLEVASALSEGASLLHARLRSLEPDDRDAVLEIMAGQLNSIVSLWTELVRAVVAPPGPDAGPSTRSHPSARLSRRQDDEGDDTAVAPSPTTTTTSAPVSSPATGTAGGGPATEPGPVVRRLPRRQTETLRRQEDRPEAGEEVPDRELWTAPLRSVKVDETDSEYEGDRLTRDELTGVLNRQAGFAALGRELDRCRRAGERFILGYVDVDGLKEINGAQGPRAGDELLRQVTAALRATLRSYDVIMRLGGDEFLFSLPGADMATAELRASEFGVILNEEAPGSSASVGFGELRGNDTLDEIISRAEVELVKNRRSRARDR